MNPKEKAKDLIEKFIPLSVQFVDGFQDNELTNQNAKASAMIHIDEILKLELIHPTMKYGMNYVNVCEYYDRVKDELQKL